MPTKSSLEPVLSLQLGSCGDVAGGRGCGGRFITLCIHVAVIFSVSSRSANIQEKPYIWIYDGCLSTCCAPLDPPLQILQFLEDRVREKPHILRSITFNKTQAKKIIKKSLSETFYWVFEKHQIQEPCNSHRQRSV